LPPAQFLNKLAIIHRHEFVTQVLYTIASRQLANRRESARFAFSCCEVEKLTAKEPLASALADSAVGVVDDYGLFRPLDYLNEYHLEWDAEDEFSARFIHAAFESIAPQDSMIDVGGGPTLYQLISARNKVKKITCAEYLESNRREVQKWLRNEADAFNWDQYFKHYLALERDAHATSIDEMKDCLRSKLGEFIPCDLNQQEPIPGPRRVFDVVSSHFCVEAICKDDDDLVSKLGKLAALARTGGYLIMSGLKEAHCYQVGDFNFYAYPMDQERFLEVLRQSGCNILAVECGPAEPDRNYGGTFSLFAQKA
jgi:hypothetical protein